MVNRQNNVVAELFNEVQGTRASRKNVVLLRQNLLESDTEEFTERFFDCLNRTLICKKSDMNADRAQRFVALFVSFLESDTEQESEPFASFTSGLIEHLLRGITSREKTVRYRVCQLLALLMTSGLSEIDEELFDGLQKALIKRVRDRESSVRVQAIIALSRLQVPSDEDLGDESDHENSTKVTEILLHVLSHDPSAEVRRAVLHNLSQSTATLPFILERARDLDPILRRQIYINILPSINGFKPLSISKRNKLLKWGLRDRDETVRLAAERMFAIDWLNLANGSILELLQRLDVVNSTVGEDVMRAFFRTRREFIPQIQFDDDFWNELNPESVFLVRCMNDFASSGETSQIVADKLPELSLIADLVVKHIVEARQQAEVEKADTEFIIENLLRLAANSDFSDEIGRRRITSNCHEILRSDLSESLLVVAVEVLSKVTLNELDLARTVQELITDLYDTLQDENEADESFHSADSSLTTETRAQSPQVVGRDEEAIQVRYIFTTLRALAIVNSLLQYTKLPLQSNPQLETLFKTIIVPAYRSHEGPICEKGIECLGQICLQDRSLAEQYLGHFLNCFAKGYEDLKILALKCVTDILMAHPTLLHTQLSTSTPDDATAADELGGKEPSLEDDLVRIYLKAFQLEEMPEVTAIASQSVSKLLLLNLLKPESPNARGLLKEMVILYYSPESAENQSLRQNLAYFFPAYCFSSPEHQSAMATIVVSSIKRITRLFRAFDQDERNDIMSISSVAHQLMDWTNPQGLVQDGISPNGQVDLIVSILKRLRSLDLDEKEELKLLTTALSKAFIPIDYDVSDILDTVTALMDLPFDAISKRAIAKFRTTLEQRVAERNEIDDAAKPRDLEAECPGDVTVGDRTEV